MSKRVAVMQPYFFPYIGYFQMIYNSNIFVVYDNVNYIQRGWIHRNKILINQTEKYFTLPIQKAPLETLIKDIKLKDFDNWREKFLKTLQNTYSRSPFFQDTISLIANTLDGNYIFLTDLLYDTLNAILLHFDYDGKLIKASDIKYNSDDHLSKEQRLEQIIKHLNANTIILPPGSVELYKNWLPDGIEKKTLLPPDIKYKHLKNKKITTPLSIIDMMMFCSKDEIKEMLNNPKLI